MKNLRYYFGKAQREKFAVGQFNFSDLALAKGIVEAAKNLKSPVILGTSEGESKFFGLEEAVALRNVLRKKTGLPIFLNLDHGKSFEYIKQAIDAGYDMVHFDGSKLSLEENIKITKEVVKYAKSASAGFGGWRRRGVLVEGELGIIGNDSSKVYAEKFEMKEEDLTSSTEALKYVNESRVDLLAISIGTFHGIEAGGENPRLRLDRLEEIAGEIKNVFLVLHGGSGTPKQDIKEAIKSGIAKININTELRLAYSDALKQSLADNPDEIVPYKYLQKPIEAVRMVTEEKILLFGSNNKI